MVSIRYSYDLKNVNPEFIKCLLKRVYDKEGYKIKILYKLSEGARSFNELKKDLGDIHQYILDKKLKELMDVNDNIEANNCIHVPLIEKIGNGKRDKYSITTYGLYVLRLLQLFSQYFINPIIEIDEQKYVGGIIYPSDKYLNNLRWIILNAGRNPEKLMHTIIKEKIDPTNISSISSDKRLEASQGNASIKAKYLIIYPSSSKKFLTFLSPKDFLRAIDESVKGTLYYTGLVISGKVLKKLKDTHHPSGHIFRNSHMYVKNLLIVDHVIQEWNLEKAIDKENGIILSEQLDIILYLKRNQNNILIKKPYYLEVLGKHVRLHVIPKLVNNNKNEEIIINLEFKDIHLQYNHFPVVINVYNYDVYPIIFIKNKLGGGVYPVILYRELVFRKNNINVIKKSIKCMCGDYHKISDIHHQDNVSSDFNTKSGLINEICNSYTCFDNTVHNSKPGKLLITYDVLGNSVLSPVLLELDIIRKVRPGRKNQFSEYAI